MIVLTHICGLTKHVFFQMSSDHAECRPGSANLCWFVLKVHPEKARVMVPKIAPPQFNALKKFLIRADITLT